jgi:hypothetical protein
MEKEGWDKCQPAKPEKEKFVKAVLLAGAGFRMDFQGP